MRDSQFTTKDGMSNLHLNRRTHWTLFINGNYFESYWFPPPKTIKKDNTERNGKCVLSKYKKQGKDNYCAAYFLYKILLTNYIKIDDNSAVLQL